MYNHVFSAHIEGINAQIIQIEADISDGLPIFNLVGYLASSVKEARERVSTSIKNLGYRFPAKRITINLSPADLRKSGSTFDLGIAIALLTSFGLIPEKETEHSMILGELGLGGEVKGIRGVLPMVLSAKEHSLSTCIVPIDNVKEASVVEDMTIIGVRSLKDAICYFRGEYIPEEVTFDPKGYFERQTDKKMDFSDVIGQLSAKRAIEIAVSGMHNLLLIGPPGTGKTMLARRIPTIMPKLSYKESLELTKLYSVCGLLPPEEYLIRERPFRSPHHTVTPTALIGGGRQARPGEISLASRGVLFLDEFLEFPQRILDTLRQPLEDRKVVINRLEKACVYPADIMLVAATNPCKCGYFPNQDKCSCSVNEVAAYLSKMSQPILDRMDLTTETVENHHISAESCELSSGEMLASVEIARERQRFRYRKDSFFFNSQIPPSLLSTYCHLGSQETEMLENMLAIGNGTTRGIHRVIKVSRTIADMADSEHINKEHIAKAIRYRNFDKKLWEVKVNG